MLKSPFDGCHSEGVGALSSQTLRMVVMASGRLASSADLLQNFEKIGVPAGPVYDVLQMQADPQVRAREMVTEVEHTREGKIETIGLPIKFSDTPGKVRTGAPVYGQHTREVLLEAS